MIKKGVYGMTSYQQRQVREFRRKGVGYRAIAAVVGVSRDEVRNYCKSRGLDGLGDEVMAKAKKERFCQQCNKKLPPHKSGRVSKYCSDECRQKWWSAHQDAVARSEEATYQLVCQYCGQTFSSYGNKKRKYCDPNCYIRDRFWRYEEGREPYKSPKELERERNAMANAATQGSQASGVQPSQEIESGG